MMRAEIGQLTIDESTLDEICDLRGAYLDGLLEAQELYLELLVRRARVFVLKSQERRIGYFLLGEDGTLLEYFVTREHLERMDAILGMLIEQFAIRKALCKSFDHSLLSCCSGYQTGMKAIGIHFRERQEKPASRVVEGVSCRPARLEDEEPIIAINEAVFDQDEEVREYIEAGQVLVFEKDAEMAGFGIFARVIAGRPEFDIGMLVARKFRRQGYGEYIIRLLADFCQRNGWRPVCGCAIENEASRRCLEKAGFIGRYRLLEFVF